MYYVAGEKGFLTWIDHQREDRHHIHSQPDIRHAYPFYTFEEADQAAKEYLVGTPYAILSTAAEAARSGRVFRSYALEQAHAKTHARNFHQYIRRVDIDVEKVIHDDNDRLMGLRLALIDGLAITHDWPDYVIVNGTKVLKFECTMAVPALRVASSVFGAAMYKRVHDTTLGTARQSPHIFITLPVRDA